MDRTDVAALETWWAAKLEMTEPILAGAGITAAWWSFDISEREPGTGYTTATFSNADDINQCLAIIAKTPRGEDPHRPNFASNVHDYIDWPIPEARPYVVRELTQAVNTWEPRVQLDSLSINEFDPTISSMSVSAQWSLAGFATQTEITLN